MKIKKQNGKEYPITSFLIKINHEECTLTVKAQSDLMPIMPETTVKFTSLEAENQRRMLEIIKDNIENFVKTVESY